MTNHYHIEITATQTVFKVTYRDSKFRSLQHLRGRLNDAMLKELGRIIPRLETNFEAFSKLHHGNVKYSCITADKTIYTQFVESWYSFYERFYQLPPKFTGVDGRAMKSIIAHLKLLGNSETEGLALWRIILEKWHTLNDFHKENADLKYIDSKLNIILNAIKQQNNTYAHGSDRSVEL